MTWIEFARQALPDASDDLLDDLLWSRTAFPFCDAKHTYSQLMHYKIMKSIHWGRMCDLCGNPITKKYGCCPQCHRALRRPHPDDKVQHQPRGTTSSGT